MKNKINLYKYIQKYNIKTILDIGANVGQFALEIRSSFPQMFILCIEPNSDCESHLRNLGLNYIICCPSDSKTTKKFYRMKSDPTGTGHSLYKENTYHYEGENLLIQEIQTDTMDSILEQSSFNNLSFDFIKLDTQGSELDILKGSSKLLTNAKIILAETDVSNYNQGCPTQKDVIEFMQKNGFGVDCVIEDHITPKGKTIQQDLLFIREK